VSLAILCPGQGSQNAEMFDVIAGNPEAEAVVAMAGSVLPAAARDMANGANIHQNRIAQPLLCAAILARWQALERELPQPELVLGYSVGEIAAHAVAGTYSIADCLRLAARRAELMDDASPPNSGLIAILGMNETQVRALCDESASELAIVNAATHYVLGGTSASLDAAGRIARSRGARAFRLKVGVPAHTSWLREAATAFERELGSVAVRSPRTPVLAGVDGHRIRNGSDARTSLAAQVAQVVNWRRCIAHAVEMGITVFLELGPGNALARIVHESFPKVQARSLDDFRTLAGAIATIRRALQ
jgi:[acyl-carrier-protein] S-malonyltransferase